MGILRFLLALSVVTAHCGDFGIFYFVDAQIAVQSFFIISGFYMSLILNEKYTGKNNSYKLFITNRFIRLYPIYWAVLIATILASIGEGIVTKGQSYGIFDFYMLVKANLFSFGYLILTNLLVFGQAMVTFLGIIPENGHLFLTADYRTTVPELQSFIFIPQAWTLGLELTFYLIAPFILKKGLKIVVSLIAVSLFLNLFIYNYVGGLQDDHPWTYRFFPTALMFFLLGYLSYKIHLRIKKITVPRYINVSILLFMIAFSFVFLFLPPIKIPYTPFKVRELVYFLSIFLSIPFLFNFLKRSKFDNQIGELSYPMYISHMLVYEISMGQPFMLLKHGWVIALLTIIFSLLLNKFIASPFEKYRQSRLKK